jgi:ferric-dicitrate binding protein FerR (iron transport regulator)
MYVRLQRQHPDTLSERAWHRLQSLDRDCAAARAQAQTEMSDMGMGHRRGGAWMGMGVVAVALMAIMMTALR